MKDILFIKIWKENFLNCMKGFFWIFGFLLILTILILLGFCFNYLFGTWGIIPFAFVLLLGMITFVSYENYKYQKKSNESH